MDCKPCLLLCTDLDRTIIPNGVQPESQDARRRFSHLCHHPFVTVVYVTGRHRSLVEEAIEQYQLPIPDYAITDVGSKIYHISDGEWSELTPWLDEIDQDWQGKSAEQLSALLVDIGGLQRQESHKQNRHKLSYYVSLPLEHESLIEQVEQRLQHQAIEASLIWSIDELQSVGLLDVLPKSASKEHAIRFLYQRLGIPINQVVFAGDSGNDMAVLVSDIPSVLVANSSLEIQAAAQQQGNSETLYIADGRQLGMNGNYAAGVLEGVWHYAEAFRNLVEEST